MKILRRLRKNQMDVWVLLLVIFQLVFPYNFVSAQNLAGLAVDTKAEDQVLTSQPMVDREVFDCGIPQECLIGLITPIRHYIVVETYKIPVTAYSSTVDQTDSTPCITANGFDLCEHNQENVIAANFLPFGTKVRIPELFGDRVFVVQDRMNARYYYHADVWMQTRQAAKDFGLKYTELEIIE